ncbi:protein phosphatase 1 regulatory subunit 12A-like [Ylistrum balloti]|uniref:protein phosphatase 1 regulatory subunit 12A-like n=1 Tax=Ylistrum balloti TaxID=509963 RepID=UPI002905CBF0|nr:protein phosphatase 1 regulatory subunit 12A-like [Ylistrum balloti]
MAVRQKADSDLEDLYLAHQAAANGDNSLLIQAIQKDPSVIEQPDIDGFTPLSHAVRSEQLGAVKRLIKMGADVNTRDGQGRTCLSTAAYQGWYDGVMYLLRKGAKQNISDKSGRTPLHACTYDKDIRIIGVLLQTLTNQEVNQPDNEKMTPLHWAAFHDRPEHVQMLIMHGSDMTCQDVDNKTALHWAAQKGSIGSCRVLIQCAKNQRFVNIPDSSGKTAVHYAAAAGNVNILQELAKLMGCELECEDPDDRTPLHWATAMGHMSCVALLLRLKVTPNPVDIEGGTPLDYAQQSGHKECQALLEKAMGIKPNSHPETKTKPWKRTFDNNSSRKGTVRNPIWKLKDLFRPRHKKSTTGTPTSDTTNTSDSIEMKTLVPDSASSRDTSGRSRVRKNSIELRTQRLTHRSTQEKTILNSLSNQNETMLNNSSLQRETTLHRETMNKPVVRRTMTIPIPILTVSQPDDDDDTPGRPIASARSQLRSARSLKSPMSSLIVEHALIHREKDSSDSDNSPPKGSPPWGSPPKDSPPRQLIVPKIVLSTVTDLDADQSPKQRRKNRKSARKSPHPDPLHIPLPQPYMITQPIGMPVSPNLPPVMTPRLSPLSTNVLPRQLPSRKKQEDLAPLRIPPSPIPVPMRMPAPTSPAGFRGRHADRPKKSPTPPPTIKLWPSDENIPQQPSPNLSPSPLVFDSETSEKIRRSVHRRLSGFSEKSGISRRLSGLSEASQFLTVDERDRFGGGGSDHLSLSSGSRLSMHSGSQYSGPRSPLPSARSDARSIQLTPLNNSFGSNTSGTLLCASPVPMTTMEKKSMDRSIQSLLH